MLSPAHFFTAYIISDYFVPNPQKYVWAILVFSTFVDLDHIPGLIHYARLPKSQRQKMTMSDLVDWCRTPLQEPVGVLVFLAGCVALYFVGVKSNYVPLAAIGMVSHWALDFISVHNRPFDPVNRRIVLWYCDTVPRRLWTEGIYTLITGLAFVVLYFKLY